MENREHNNKIEKQKKDNMRAWKGSGFEQSSICTNLNPCNPVSFDTNHACCLAFYAKNHVSHYNLHKNYWRYKK